MCGLNLLGQTWLDSSSLRWCVMQHRELQLGKPCHFLVGKGDMVTQLCQHSHGGTSLQGDGLFLDYPSEQSIERYWPALEEVLLHSPSLGTYGHLFLVCLTHWP